MQKDIKLFKNSLILGLDIPPVDEVYTIVWKIVFISVSPAPTYKEQNHIL